MAPTALGFPRFRPRRTRVRREPIDLDLLAAELGDRALVGAPVRVAVASAPRSQREILFALEAEVSRLHATRSEAIDEITVVPEPDPVVLVEEDADPFGIQETSPVASVAPVAPVEAPVEAPTLAPVPTPGVNVGLPLDQVQAWLDQVDDDIRKIEARIEYLQAEQARLQSQHQLVAELISSSNPV